MVIVAFEQGVHLHCHELSCIKIFGFHFHGQFEQIEELTGVEAIEKDHFVALFLHNFNVGMQSFELMEQFFLGGLFQKLYHHPKLLFPLLSPNFLQLFLAFTIKKRIFFLLHSRKLLRQYIFPHLHIQPIKLFHIKFLQILHFLNNTPIVSIMRRALLNMRCMSSSNCSYFL